MPEININETTPALKMRLLICWAVPEPQNRRWCNIAYGRRHTRRDGDRSERMTKKFGDFAATDHVNFAVKRGRFLVCWGQTARVNRPPLRCVRFAGADLWSGAGAGDGSEKSSGKARQHLGYMAQKFSLYAT